MSCLFPSECILPPVRKRKPEEDAKPVADGRAAPLSGLSSNGVLINRSCVVAYAKGKAEEQQAEEEGLALRERVRTAYPFHPALIDVMREQWAAIPDFQRTRGALLGGMPACHAPRGQESRSARAG